MKNIRTLLLTAALSLMAASTLSAQAIVGAWTFGNTSSPDSTGTGAVIFLANGAYFHLETGNIDASPSGFDGIERGTYTWNSDTNALNVISSALDTNGDIGLAELVGGPSLNIDASGNTFTVDGQLFTRVIGASDEVGAWTFGDTLNPGSENTGALVFLSNGVYFHLEELRDGGGGATGLERGTYTWNSGTGVLTSSQLVDSDGDLGLSDVYSGILVSISGNDLSAINTDGDGVGTFAATRVTAVPEPSTYAVIAGALCLGIVMLRRRKQN